jgi:hypothetical protein
VNLARFRAKFGKVVFSLLVFGRTQKQKKAGKSYCTALYLETPADRDLKRAVSTRLDVSYNLREKLGSKLFCFLIKLWRQSAADNKSFLLIN